MHCTLPRILCKIKLFRKTLFSKTGYTPKIWILYSFWHAQQWVGIFSPLFIRCKRGIYSVYNKAISLIALSCLLVVSRDAKPQVCEVLLCCLLFGKLEEFCCKGHPETFNWMKMARIYFFKFQKAELYSYISADSFVADHRLILSMYLWYFGDMAR